jgi:hypothetical protein
VGASKEKKATGRKADVVLAAYYAAEAALRHLKPGCTVNITEQNARRFKLNQITIEMF